MYRRTGQNVSGKHSLGGTLRGASELRSWKLMLEESWTFFPAALEHG